jgi:hypothetical protein
LLRHEGKGLREIYDPGGPGITAVDDIEIEVPRSGIHDLLDDQVKRFLDEKLFLTEEKVEGKDPSLLQVAYELKILYHEKSKGRMQNAK